MITLHARNVNEAYTIGLNMIKVQGVPEPSRVGDVLVMDCPVTTTYTNPNERVLFNASRNANPFFHLMESLWMLAGRNDVSWIKPFNSSFDQFSDDGKVFHGAYGYRWRKHFDRDQLNDVCTLLKTDPNSRRAFIGMWDPRADDGIGGLDYPCNVGISLRCRQGALDLTVFNRSNDIIWGAYGANAVHMSILQEYLAAQIDMEIGAYHQVSNNYHAYVDVLDKVGIPDPHPMDPYSIGDVKPFKMITNPDTFMDELTTFMDIVFNYMNNKPTQLNCLFTNTFFTEIALPMVYAWKMQKQGKLLNALAEIQAMALCDWQVACSMWIKRKVERNEFKTTGRERSKVAHDTD